MSTDRHFIVAKIGLKGIPTVEIREVTPGSCAHTLTRTEAWTFANKLGQAVNVRGGTKHGYLPIFFTDLNMDRTQVATAANNTAPQAELTATAPVEAEVTADAPVAAPVAEYEWLKAQDVSGNTFLTSLKNQLASKGKLSDKQRDCITKAIEKAQATPTRSDVAAPGASVNVPDGRYAITRNDKVMFYKVENGKAGSRWEGYTFLKVQASDDLFPVKDKDARTEILAAIAQDPRAASIAYGKEIGACGLCNITLTHPDSIANGIGPICAGKQGW
jgi:hypothetical protein